MLVIIIDQLVKFWVDRNVNWTNPTRPIIPGILSLVRVQNDGAAFSFLSGSGARIWFVVITAIFALLVILALATNFISGKFGRWCLVFITAGGLSNMIDRIRYGFVIDMFKIELFDFAVFNVADIFITVFCLAFIIYILFGGEKDAGDDGDEFDEIDSEDEDRPRRTNKKPVKKRNDYYDDEEEDDDYRSPAKRSSKTTSRKAKRSDVNEDDEFLDEPIRKSDRSAIAAATAYSTPSRRPATKEDSPRRRSTYDEPSTPNTASSSMNFDEMFGVKETAPAKRSSAAPASRPRRESTANSIPSAAPARRSAPVSSPATDPNNPFAEWERANAKAAEKTSFNSFVEDTNKITSAATEKVEEKVTEVAKQAKKDVESFSDDFDLDSILNEFK